MVNIKVKSYTRNPRTMKEYRVFDGKKYQIAHLASTKKEAKRLSNGNREGNLNSRVIKNKTYGYAIYTRRKQK